VRLFCSVDARPRREVADEFNKRYPDACSWSRDLFKKCKESFSVVDKSYSGLSKPRNKFAKLS
jgi:hypothetical protein